MSSKVIKFPDKEYILKCHKCKVNTFYVILNSEDYRDVKGFECAECGVYTEVRISGSEVEEVKI